MECTQRLENHSISKDAENYKKEIGCLSIKEKNYPLKNGHNIIGRDPQRCNVVIDLCSISKTHAIIISKGDRVTVMDMNSTNKTFLLREPDKHLDPWEHYPIHNGELLQFGNVYATLELHECEIDLPATQALNLPITSPLVCDVKTTKPTTIPESPDFSDRDDSYIVASQSEKETPLKSKCQFIKPCNKMKPIQPVGTNKIDNIYWNSSRRSNSLNISSDNISSHNIPVLPSLQNNIDDIYDLETQNPIKPFASQSKNSNYSGNTELSSPSILKPPETESVDDIYDLQTQLLIPKEPVSVTETINIHEMQTQCLIPYEDGVPDVDESLDIHEMETQMNLPKVQKIKIQHEMQLDLSISNEKKNDTIVNGEIQQIDQLSPHTDTGRTLELSKSYVKSEGIARKSNNLTYQEKERKEHYHQNLADNISLKKCKKDDKQNKSSSSDHELLQKSKETEIREENANESNSVPFEEMCTQVLYENTVEHPKDTIENNNLYSEEIVTPFKIPQIFNAKKKDALDEKSRAVFSLVNARDAKEMKFLELEEDENEDLQVADMYYAHTQDLLEDLCSPKSPSPDKNKSQVISPGNNSSISDEGKGVSTFISNLIPDIDVTPKKLRPTFSDSELPLSQELKTRWQKPTDVIDTLVDSDTECLEDPSTPVLFRPKSNQKLDAKKGLPQSLHVDGLPSRIMLRNVKPTSKFLETFGSANLLQRELFQEPTCELDAQLLNDNIIALKNVSEKKNVCTDSKNRVPQNKSTTRNKVEINEKGQREKDIQSNKINSSKTYHDDHTNKNVDRINTKTDTKGNTSKTKGQLNEDSKNKKRDCNAKKGSDIVTPDKNVRITKNKDSKKGIQKEVIDNKLRKTNEATKNDRDDTVIKPSSNKIKSKDKKEDNTAEATSSDSISGRITRSSKQRKNIEIKKEEEQGQSSSKEENTSKRLRRKDTVRKSSPSPVRRSKRQKTNNQSEPVKELKSISKVVSSNEHTYENKKSIEKACVVNSKRSIETNNNVSSSGLKRSIENDNEAPSKRTRTAISNSSLRHTSRGLRTQFILFTGFPNEEVQCKLLKLGAKIVTDVKECTVVLTLQLKRTFKLLCAVGLGKPIVGPNWVQACVDTNLIVDPWLYLLKDEAVERRYQFSLEGTLKGNRNYLSGYNVYATPNVLPSAVEMKQIVECSGGNWGEDSSSSANCICISCKADSHLWPTIRSKCRAIVTTEFILAGVLRQKVDFNKYSIIK